MLARIWNSAFWVEETDPKALGGGYLDSLERAGFTVVCCTEKHFEPQGYTALFLLAESHLAIHTFPEFGISYVELSSCNEEYFRRFQEAEPFEHIEHA